MFLYMHPTPPAPTKSHWTVQFQVEVNVRRGESRRVSGTRCSNGKPVLVLERVMGGTSSETRVADAPVCV